MKIIVCTENKAKLKAVEEVFSLVFQDFEIFGEKFLSAVAEQPLTELEGITGALNRAKNAKQKYFEADFCVGLEGFVDSNNFGMFLGGAVAIVDKEGRAGIGISAKMQLPQAIQAEILAGKELGPLIAEIMKDDNNEIRHLDGTNGILTKGLYNRVDEFKDAVKCALAKFLSPKMYK